MTLSWSATPECRTLRNPRVAARRFAFSPAPRQTTSAALLSGSARRGFQRHWNDRAVWVAGIGFTRRRRRPRRSGINVHTPSAIRGKAHGALPWRTILAALEAPHKER